MSHSYVNALFHCVFSTRERRPLLTETLRPRLFAYMGGIARQNGLKMEAVGGVRDHVHLLLSLPSTLDIAKAIQLVKGGSSKWVNATFTEAVDFAWQEGYGAFSIGISQKRRTLEYIARQEIHHRQHTYEEEFRAILTRHGIDYDERYVLG